jgi:poly(A) polymerase
MNYKDVLKDIGRVAHTSEMRVFVVGGFVRDSLRKQDTPVREIDCAVEGSGLACARAFADHVGEECGTLIEFPDFDTARFVYTSKEVVDEGAGEMIEKTTILFEVEFAGTRSESYELESRKPDVEHASLDEDLSRRDFTINAMAQEVGPDGSLGTVIDPHDGQADIKAEILKTPLLPNKTFNDDPLRMLRAARFASALHYSIAPDALHAMHAQARRLAIVSPERMQEELIKLMGTTAPSVGLSILHATGVLDFLIPEVGKLAGVEEVKGYSHKDNLSHTLAVVDNIALHSDKPLLRFAGLMHDIAKPQTKKFVKGRGWTFDMHEHLGRKMTRDIMSRLRFSNDDTAYVLSLVRWHLQPIALMDDGVTDSAVRRLVVNLGDDLDDLLVLCRADITTGNQTKKARRLLNYDVLEQRIEELREKDALRAFQSPVRGDEIMEICGLRPGPTVGKIKKAIEEAILDGVIPNEYAAAKEYFESIKDEHCAVALEREKLDTG